MQRALNYELSPPGRVPLRFLLSAPCFAVLAGLVLLGAGAEALESRWTPALLAVTHLLTLGCLSMAMIGALLQLLPAVAGQPVTLPESLVGACWMALALGALMLPCAFLLGTGWLFLLAALLLALALGLAAGAAMPAVLRRCPPGALPMVGGMRVAVPALALTAILGVTLALYLGAGVPLPVLTVLDLHVGWGLTGWVALLIVCVGFQVIPMFLQTPVYPAAATRWSAALVGALLLAWSAARLWAPALALWPAAVLALALCAFALFTLRMLARRKRQPGDATNRYWQLALASLALCCLLYLVGAPALPLGILFVGGFALGALNGMLYKIVPFLLWYGFQLEPPASTAAIPSVRALVPEARALLQFRLHTAGLALLLAALQWPALARPAALVFTAASALLARDLLGAALHCRRLRHQPS